MAHRCYELVFVSLRANQRLVCTLQLGIAFIHFYRLAAMHALSHKHHVQSQTKYEQFVGHRPCHDIVGHVDVTVDQAVLADQ